MCYEFSAVQSSSSSLSNQLIGWRTVAVITAVALFCAVGWALSENRKNKERASISRAEVLSAAARFASDSPDRLEKIFETARYMEIDEAIPLAVMYAVKPDKKDGITQYYVVAARRYLRDYDFDTISVSVRRAATSGAFKDADALLSKLPELMR